MAKNNTKTALREVGKMYSESFYLPGDAINFIRQQARRSGRSNSSQLFVFLRAIMKNPDGFNLLVLQNKQIINNSNNVVNSNNTVKKDKTVGNMNVGEGASVSISISDKPNTRSRKS